MKIWVLGIGPGGLEEMTVRAKKALASCQVVVGYKTYIEQIKPLLEGKEIMSSSMRQEVERCKMALESASSGKETAIISGGDAGVYGMAGLALELAAGYPGVSVEIVPGVTAATAAAAVLGAPIGHDFAVVSLSDLLTSWETIATRLEYAAKGDFVICLYNPGSKQRREHLRRACDILLRHKDKETPCGYVRGIGRPEQEKSLCTLKELRDRAVDMSTTVIVGNSQTRIIDGGLVTPRGYQKL